MKNDFDAWHVVAVRIRRYPSSSDRLPGIEWERVIEQHPAACDALPYGQSCWLDRELCEFPEDCYPCLSGYYAARMWGAGPDYNGEYDAGIDWELITPALAPTPITCYEVHLRRGISLPAPVNGVRIGLHARRVHLDQPLSSSPWCRTGMTP